MRKIIQLYTWKGKLTALCDDGSVWILLPNNEGGWEMLPEITQV